VLYIATLAVVFAAAIPIFRYFLFVEVDQRVRDDLREELEDFQSAYESWSRQAPQTETALLDFIDAYFSGNVPEDDNFQLVIVEESLYRSNPPFLPTVIQPSSEIFQYWATLETSERRTIATRDSEFGSILYKTLVLEIAGEPQGVFIVTHLTAGERTEALAGVYVFIKVAAGVLVMAFGLAWVGSSRLLKPVQQMAKTARDINETNLTQRLEVQGSGELAELADTFNRMMDRVQSAFDSQRSFINDASHELRTPLTIIQGHLELMGDDPAEQQEVLSLVMDELDRMGRFVNDLLLLAKAEQPHFLLPETIDLTSFLEAVFSKIVTLGDRNWQLTNTAQGKLVADSQRLTGALVNLAQNAVQHTQVGDTIELGVRLDNGHVRFWVRDTGEGIAPAEQSRIFDRFTRVKHTVRRSEGAGLGLAIVKTIMDAHGGHVELTSQSGMGSTFHLILPLDESLPWRANG
jgi:signal transduction histidine kinase